MSTALTLYLANAAASLTTADQLYSVAGTPTTTNNTTLLGTALNWGEITSQGTTGAWAAAATQAGVPPSGHGFLWDVTTLELQDLLTGTYTQTIRMSTAGVGAVTITADLHAVLYKYNGSTYTQIADCVLTGQSISTVFANYTLTFTTVANTSFAIGDKAYLHLPAKILTNTGASTQTIRLGSLSTDTAGKTGSTNSQLVTPGYQPTVPVIATSPTSLSFAATFGGTNPVSQNSTLSQTAGAGTAWTSSISYGSGSGWLAISPTSGTLATNGSQVVAFTCTTGSLAVGSYTATVTFTAATGGATATVSVTFVVSLGTNSYGAALDSGGTPNAAGTLFSTTNMLTAMLDSHTSVARYQIQWWSIERAVQTTSSTAVAAAGSATITLAAVPANFVVGASVLVDVSGSQQETVTITAQVGLTITATFANTHSGTYPVAIIPTAGDTPSSSGSPARVAAYDWSVLDDFVTTCQSNNLAIHFVLQNAPAWHQQALAIDSSKNVPVAADSATFVTALLGRYAANTFYAFEIGNEGFNTGLLTSGNASTMFTQMYNLYNAVSPVVRSNSPQTLIVSAADLNKTTSNISAWINGFYAANCQTLIDVLNYHYYNGNNGPTQPNAGQDSFAQWWTDFHTASVVNGDPTRQIWVTEFGWTLLKNNNGGVPDATYAGYVTTLINSAISSGCVSRVYIYNLGSITPGSGVHQDFTKQTYLAWKGLIGSNPNWPLSSSGGGGGGGKSVVGAYSVLVNNQPVFVLAGTLNIDSTIGRRSQASFTAKTTTATHFQQYQQVQIYDQLNNLAFSGYITNPKERKPGFQNSLLHTITCTDQHFLADKRVVAATYSNRTCGEIVQNLVTNILASEGVTIGQIFDGIPPSPTLYPSTTLYPGGNVGLIPNVTFFYCTVAQALDALTKAASFAGIPYYWQIDQNGKIWFVPYTSIVNSTVVDGTQIDQVLNPPTVTRANPLYRNTQYIVGGLAQTVQQTETRKGDGNTVAWPMGFDIAPVAPTPTVTVNGVAKTVGIKGVSTGKDFYWQQGSPIISQDSAGVKLISTDTLQVVYIGQYPSVVVSGNAAQVTYQGSLDGTSGIIEGVEQDNTIGSVSDAMNEASQLLTLYASQGIIFEFSTLQAGFQQGQLITVNLPVHGFNNAQMLIEQVTASDMVDGINIWYRVRCVQGPFDTSWVQFFSKMLTQRAPADSINVGLSQTSAILQSFTASVTATATLNVTVAACPVVSSSLFPNTNLFPC